VRALHRTRLPPSTAAPHPAFTARISSAQAHTASAVYTGLGFDACSAPSPHAMSAWGSSPYHALGIYIGGTNAACSQPNLTASWISSEVAAGWHFLPTYVGLQAPSNSCGCAGVTPSQASAQGTSAAENAVAEAQSLGIPPGNPIYDDMESYSRTQANTTAVLNFLSGWTSELHALGYTSGVYSSAGAGITDLVNQYGTSYPEPDDLWIADWNGQQGTSDSAVPSSDWQNHQRVHQYRGGHNETYGGVTINIDNDYLDAATADTSGGAGSAQAPPIAPPALSVLPTADGTTNLSATWSSGSGLSRWRVLAGSTQTALTTIASAAAQGAQAKISVRSAAPFFAVQALGSSGQVLASSSTIPSPAHLVLYGHSAFVNQATGTGGIPAGCYTGTTCHVATTISAGRTTIATTGTEAIQPGGTAILFFTLTPQGRTLLRHARGARLGVKVSARDVSGTTSIDNLSLIPFSTAGRGPARSFAQSQVAQIVGGTDFVYAHGSGGILAGCGTAAPCPIAATLSVGRTQIAATRPEIVGGGELGYLFFSLTAKGRSMLTRAVTNQLGVTLTISSGSSVATARIALVQFS
ncbi:MAG TPA: DUF1906 domain-containing protein, partial [Solirubrobacteraceae bacterium]|nr:DUF1906 domain-containing protein [Solirubrobacteraceae bacterium]